ncbi:MAG: hypothetical protein GX617_09600 [Lentisphaerae bacterium]|nr:hypothetical protein [Lentisphaerota bacterium]
MAIVKQGGGAFFVSREGAKTRRRRFYPQITQMNADYGGMSCRCAASHAAGFKALFCLTRRRAGAQARRRHFWKMRLFLHEEEN